MTQEFESLKKLQTLRKQQKGTKHTMESLVELQKLQKFVERQRQEVERAKGALEENLKILKRDYGCSTLKQAQKKLQEMESEQEEQQKDFDKALRVFKDKWFSESEENAE